MDTQRRGRAPVLQSGVSLAEGRRRDEGGAGMSGEAKVEGLEGCGWWFGSFSENSGSHGRF